jgi:hypothetical protein
MGTTSQRRCAALLIALSILYAIFFVPPNLTGTDDVSMLAAFELDEFGQYKVLWRMTAGGDASRSGLSRFILYDHYYYGFPFFFVSALAFWPLKAAYIAADAPGLTQASMLVLRQLSPAFMLAAILALVFAWTRFRDPIRSVALFAFLVSIPAVVSNNLWWHPDSLATLFAVLTLVSLSEDRGRLGRWFTGAAVFCGLAAGTKLIGLWFFAAVGVHLLMQRSRLGWLELARHGARFVAVMALAIVASNPHLLIPSEAHKTFEILSGQAELNASGWEVQSDETGVGIWYARALSRGFGFWWFHAWMLAFCAVTIRFDREKRPLAIAILAWVLPVSLYLMFDVAKTVERYFLPMLLPLMSCIASTAPWRYLGEMGKPALRRAAAGAFAAVTLFQVSTFAIEDVRRYRLVLHREETSPSLIFTRNLESEVFSRWSPDAPIRIFRDAAVYVRPLPRYEVHLRWRAPDHQDVVEIQPDLILLRQEEIERFRDSSIIAEAFDTEQTRRSYAFYRDVRGDSIPGYRRILETDFGVAFLRRDSSDPSPPAGSEAPTQPARGVRTD